MNQLFSIFMPRVSITSCLPFYPYYIMAQRSLLKYIIFESIGVTRAPISSKTGESMFIKGTLFFSWFITDSPVVNRMHGNLELL